MRNKKLFYPVLAILLAAVVFLIFYPFRSEPMEEENFTPYIAAFTSGTVSNQSAIRVMLVEEAPEATPGKRAEKDLFDFKPDIRGEAFWLDSRTLEFRPVKKLPAGKEFEAEFSLDKVAEVPGDLKDFIFSFQTISQSYETEFKGLHAYDPQDLKYQQMVGEVHTADYAGLDEVRAMLRAVQDNQERTVSWQHGPDGKNHRFTVDSVVRKEKQASVELVWNGSAIGAARDRKETITIPSLSEFEVLSVDVSQYPEQSISVVFSDPIDEDQQIEGLIRLKSGTELTHLIDGNQLKLFPATRQKGRDELIIEPTVLNTLGYKLDEKWSARISFQSIKPAVEFLGDGNILPDSDRLNLPFRAVSLSGVNVRIIKIFEENVPQFFQVNQYSGDSELKRVGRIVYHDDIKLTSDKPLDYSEWNTFSLDLSRLIKPEPGAIYRVQINFDRSQSLYPCSGDDKAAEESMDPERFDQRETTDESDLHYWHYRGYDYYDYDDDYNWQERDDPCKDSYYMRYNQAVAKNVLASDLGLVAKKGKDDALYVVVTDLKSTAPQGGVQLKVFNFQQRLIATKQTDNEGMARMAFDSKPYLIIAQKGKQYGYLRVDEGSSLSLSRFNVSGRETQHGLKGFIYGERGVWRPGDSLFLSFMLHDERHRLPEEHPVLLEMVNPRGQVVQRKVQNAGVNGLYTFRTTTSSEAPTGVWKARVKVGGAVFTRDLRIETIKPNRLKLNLDFDTEGFTSEELHPTGKLEVKWLHGAPADQLKAEVRMRLVSSETSFPDYPGYHFDDPSRSFSPEEQTLFDGRLDQAGRATLQADLEVGDQAPGRLTAGFSLKAFEESGNFSTTRMSVPYSPYSSYVGMKVPEGSGWQGALSYDEPYSLPVVSVDERGNPINRDNLEVQIYKISWRWWWERNEQDNLSRYVGASSRYLLHKGQLSTQNGEGSYQFKIGEKFWGRILIRVVDKNSGHSTGQIAYVTYPGWDQSQAPGGASMLSFSTDKDTYRTGEQVQVKVPSSAGGRILVSLENGSGVLETFWVETTKKFTEFSFEATQQMAPNVYVHLSLLQPHNQTKNDMPVRLYGVRPVRVEHQATHLKPVVNQPEEIRPLEKMTISVKEENGSPMNYTLALVDEGLLDITAFQTPRPWDHFYARDALGVQTWDMFDYVIGAYTGELAGLFEVGGGLDSRETGEAKARRFPPVVKFFGPFHLRSDQSRNHTFTMPNYVGSVKTMLVAGHNGTYGSAEKVTLVKKPLMVQATLPRVVGPGEKIDLPVTVFAMEPGIREVQVEVETNDMLVPESSSSKVLHFSEKGDQVTGFTYQVPEKPGVAHVKVTARAGSERAETSTELQVRSPNPRMSRVIDTTLKAGQAYSARIRPVGMQGTNHATLEVGSLVPMNLENRMDWLIRYPHGCVEQVTSSVFPQLYLENLMELNRERKSEIQENVRSAIDKLVEFQLPEGGFAYWPGHESVSHWGTNYAGHFLLEAENKGYELPEGMMDRWISYQRKAARNWSAENYYDTYRNTNLTQAYRLYVLALAGEPEKGAMNRLRKADQLDVPSQWRLAAAYFLTGKDQVAQSLIEGQETEVDAYHELSHTYGSHIRDKAMILETLTMMGQKDRALRLLRELADQVASGRWLSTQTTAYSLMAISKYLGAHRPDEPLKFEYSIDKGPWKKMTTHQPFAQIDLPIQGRTSLPMEVRNISENTIFPRIMLDGIPAAGDVQDEEHNLEMQVRYLDMKGNTIDVSRLEQGTDFLARVSITNRDIQDLDEMALTQIFPSGWEIHNFRLDQYDQSGNEGDRPEYQDIRDDRVYTYFDLKEREKKVFVVRLNAAYRGRYYLPAVYCEAMYDHSIRAQKKGQWVEVVQPGSK